MSDTGTLPGGNGLPPAPVGASSVGGGAGGATPPAGSDTVGGGASIDWGQFNAGLQRLGDTFAEKLDALRGDVSQLPEHLRPPAQEPPPPDYDTMTQADLAAHITGNVMKAFEAKLNEMLRPLAQQIQQVQHSTATREVTQEVTAMRTEHKDFNEWKDEMLGLAKTHPTLGIRQLYNLVRAENSEKAKTLDARYNPPPPPPPPRWGGLSPSAPGATGAIPKLSREDAGKEAYREVASRHPGVLAALEAM